MLARTAVPALNHLLEGADWARERLRHFAGRHVRLTGGPLAFELAVDGEGYFRVQDQSAGEPPAVTIELPADTPIRLLTDRQSVFANARLSGTADFAETLAFVFRNLRWDVEEDLAKLVGDIVARRLVRSGEAMLGWQKKAGANLAANVAEYLTEESLVIVPAREVAQFRAQVDAVQSDLARLEKRVARL